MSTQMTPQNIQAARLPRRLLKSTGAVLLRFIAVVALSLCTDEVFHLLMVKLKIKGLTQSARRYRGEHQTQGGSTALAITGSP